MSDIPEADRLDHAPHPRETMGLVGHRVAEAALLESWRSGRMHHAWILGGPQGIGKATLAWRLARFVLANLEPARMAEAADLSTNPANPAVRRMLAQAHPDVLLLRRVWNSDRKALYQDIRVEDVRKITSFFGSTAGEGGWRVAIVDAADDLNANGANALLKMLEEPPARALFLIISHHPGRLLPTLRSRCRRLDLAPLTVDDTAHAAALARPDLDRDWLKEAAKIADGSVRRALTLAEGDGVSIHKALFALLERLPSLDNGAVHSFADSLAGKKGEDAFALFETFLDDWLHARATRGAESIGRRARFAEIAGKAREAARTAEIYNLDRKPHILQVFRMLADASRN